MVELFIAALASLFSVLNPMGAIPVYMAMTPVYTPAERKRTALLTGLYVTLILLVFYFAGTLILSFFGISINAMRIAGGFVILNMGFSLLSGHFAESRAINDKVEEEAKVKNDISFSPLAMPLISGPGSISLLIGWFNEYTGLQARLIICLVVILNGLIVFLILRFSPLLFRILGVSGLKALSRIMGFIVMAIGVEFILSGSYFLIERLMEQ